MDSNLVPEVLVKEAGFELQYGKKPGEDMLLKGAGAEYRIPTDGYTDRHRIMGMVQQSVSQPAKDLVLVAKVPVHVLDTGVGFEILKRLKEGKVPKGRPPLWGGLYETHLQDHLDADGENFIPIPDDAVYVNMVIFQYEKILVKGKFKLDEVDCGGECGEARKHCHLVRANYYHTHTFACDWTAEKDTPDAIGGTVYLAPPIPSPLGSDIKITTRRAFLVNRAVEAEEPTAPSVTGGPSAEAFDETFTSSPGPSSEGSQCNGDEDNLCTSNAEMAAKAKASNSLEHLRRLTRMAQNVSLRKLDHLSSSTNSMNKLKRQLGASYEDKILPLIGNNDIEAMILASESLARRLSPHDASRYDRYLGYFLNRIGAGDAKIMQREDGIVVHE
jgi:hypothetical protein